MGVTGSVLAFMGMCEAFVFLPFLPLVHGHFQHTCGWRAETVDDVVASVWTTVWALGQSLGPVLGGAMMDAFPHTPEIRCEGGKEGRGEGKEGGNPADCRSAFAWSATAWGVGGLVLTALLTVGRFRAVCRRQEDRNGAGLPEARVGGEKGREGKEGESLNAVMAGKENGGSLDRLPLPPSESPAPTSLPPFPPHPSMIPFSSSSYTSPFPPPRSDPTPFLPPHASSPWGDRDISSLADSSPQRQAMLKSRSIHALIIPRRRVLSALHL
jgi:hypothetical protein